ncbi:MAG: type II/IV secretion system ATPase subunit [DPANN group archaeon]|nr:type II/IV secretion system ATPase subunit [DPANN group archaeon]
MKVSVKKSFSKLAKSYNTYRLASNKKALFMEQNDGNSSTNNINNNTNTSSITHVKEIVKYVDSKDSSNSDNKQYNDGSSEDVDYTPVDIGNLFVTKKNILKQHEHELEEVDVKYPVTPVAPKNGEKIYAWVNIKWDKTDNSLVYYIIEPYVTAEDLKRIDQIKKVIEEEIDIDFQSFNKESAKDYLTDNLKVIIDRFGVTIGAEKMDVYKYYVLRDFIGFGALQPILDDENIEDISCDGSDIPIFVYHRDPRFGSIKTSVLLDDAYLDDLVMKMAQRSGRSISMAEPILQGALPDGSRVQATLATDVATRGSNFTIRKFSKEPHTPVNMLKYKTMDSKLLSYLWFAIENSKSVFVVGATAAGKTSLLNALSLFIKPDFKIVSIEDTPEIQLPHEHWVAEVARTETEEGPKKKGSVDMFELLKGSLRQRPDFIIVGEIRGIEASVLFQQMATGHPGISTFHADSIEKVIDRLTTRPINLSPTLLENLDIVLFAKRLRYKNGYIRRVVEVREIIKYDTEKKKLITNKVFSWDPLTDTFKVAATSYLLGKISKQTGISQNEIKEEIKNRMKVLEWMGDKYITHYKRVGEVIKSYYNNPSDILEIIDGESKN